MSYKLESNEHNILVKEAFEQWSHSAPDMFFISSDGQKIFAHKIILSFFSPMIKDIIESTNQDIGITVFAPSSQILSMLKILTKGIAVARDKDELEQISELVQSIGIDFKNWQIGSRRQHQNMKISSRKKQKDKVTKVFSSNKNNNTLNKKLLNLPSQDEEKTSGSKHICNDCGRSFQQKSKLTRHEVLHSGIKFGCNACSFKNSRKDKLSKHIRENHPDMDFEELYKNSSTITNDKDASGLEQKMKSDEIISNDEVSSEIKLETHYQEDETENENESSGNQLNSYEEDSSEPKQKMYEQDEPDHFVSMNGL